MPKRRSILKLISCSFALKAVGSPLIASASNPDEVNFSDWLASNHRMPDSAAFEAALSHCSTLRATLLLPPGEYTISDTVKIPSNAKVRGIKGKTTIRYVGSTPREIFLAENQSNIELNGISFNGGMSVAQKATKYYVRGVRFINCQNINVVDCEISHCADWHLSFEKCSHVRVSTVAVTGDGDGRPGGRDGVHFLDSSDIAVRDIDAMTGDDCVAFTVESGICENVVLENIRGRSAIGSVLIFNEEHEAVSTFRNIAVNGVFATAQVRDVIRVQAINSGTKISDVSIQNVKGNSRNHGVFLAHANGVKVSNVDVTSANQNGVYCVGIDNLALSQVRGTALNKTFDGVHVQNCANVRGADLTTSSGSDGIAFIDNQNVVLSTPDSSKSTTGGLDSKEKIPPSLQRAKFVQNNGLRFVSRTSN